MAEQRGELQVLEHFKECISNAMKEYVTGFAISSRLEEAIRYSLEGGGKLLRPLLVLTMYSDLVSSYSIPTFVQRVALGFEFLHVASLIHDDLPALDNDSERRGRPSSHVAFDEGTAVLAGDALVGLAMQSASRAECSRRIVAQCLQVLSESWIRLCDGQVLDIIGDKSDRHTLERKTGALFSGALICGFLLADGTNDEFRLLLEQFGQRLGVVFQLLDDCADADEERRGEDYDSKLGREVSLLEADFAACDLNAAKCTPGKSLALTGFLIRSVMGIKI